MYTTFVNSCFKVWTYLASLHQWDWYRQRCKGTACGVQIKSWLLPGYHVSILYEAVGLLRTVMNVNSSHLQHYHYYKHLTIYNEMYKTK